MKEIKHNKIALIGFMGSGKTSVGKELAQRLELELCDTDEIIEKKTNLAITDIFEQKGEECFRRIEQQVLHNLEAKQNLVISTGGGIVLDTANREFLSKQCLVIWLHSSIETAFTRCATENRPLLNKSHDIGTAIKLYNERKKLYASIADISICTEERSIKNIVETICKKRSNLQELVEV